MKKEYTVLFKERDGSNYEFTFTTDNIEKTIQEYTSTRHIVEYEILKEGISNKRQMLFG